MFPIHGWYFQDPDGTTPYHGILSCPLPRGIPPIIYSSNQLLRLKTKDFTKDSKILNHVHGFLEVARRVSLHCSSFSSIFLSFVKYAKILFLGDGGAHDLVTLEFNMSVILVKYS